MRRFSVDRLVAEAGELAASASRRVILFGIPEEKDAVGSGAWDEDGIVQRAVRALRAGPGARAHHRRLPLRVHRPRPLRRRRATARSTNDATLELLARTAVSHAERRRRRRRAERHDGRPGRRHPRGARRAGFADVRSWPTPPSTPRRSTGRSATPPSRARSSATGAATRWTRPTAARRCARSRSTSRRAPTSLMVKPALAYLDVIRARARALRRAARRLQRLGRVRDGQGGRRGAAGSTSAAALESLTAIKRAGADLIFTYWAKELAQWL